MENLQQVRLADLWDQLAKIQGEVQTETLVKAKQTSIEPSTTERVLQAKAIVMTRSAFKDLENRVINQNIPDEWKPICTNFLDAAKDLFYAMNGGFQKTVMAAFRENSQN